MDAKPLTVGMKADEVLKMRGRSEDYSVRGPKVIEAGPEGLRVVEWYYEDCTVELRHDGALWRVSEVRDAG